MNNLLEKIILINIILFNFHNDVLLTNAENTNELDQTTMSTVYNKTIDKLPKRFSLSNKILTGIRKKVLNTITDIIQDIVNKTDVNKLKQCYNGEFGGQDLNLFYKPIKYVIKKYFEFKGHRNLFIDNNKKIQQIVITFIHNIRELLHRIRKCLFSSKEQQMIRGLTSLSHLSYDEYRGLLNNKLFSSNDNQNETFTICPDIKTVDLIPEEFDWNKQGKVTACKQQMTCNSCSIFASVGAVESAYLIHGNKKFKKNDVDISEQAIVDCFKYDVCKKGGSILSVWKIMKVQGIADEHDSKYEGKQNSYACQGLPKSKLNYEIIDWCGHDRNDEMFIQKYILKYGPVIAGINGDSKDFQFTRGVFRGKCDIKINHGIVITGWTKNNWIIKNSWGLNWGIDGFLFLPRRQNKCGINQSMGITFGRNI